MQMMMKAKEGRNLVMKNLGRKRKNSVSEVAGGNIIRERDGIISEDLKAKTERLQKQRALIRARMQMDVIDSENIDQQSKVQHKQQKAELPQQHKRLMSP